MSFHWFHVSLVTSYSTTGLWKNLRHVVQGESVKMNHMTPSESSEVWSYDAPGLLQRTYGDEPQGRVFFDEERALVKNNWQVTGQTICLSQARSNKLRSTAGERCHQQSQVVERTSAKVSGEKSESIFSIQTSLQRRSSLLYQGNKLVGRHTKTRPLLPVDPHWLVQPLCVQTQHLNLCCFRFWPLILNKNTSLTKFYLKQQWLGFLLTCGSRTRFKQELQSVRG